MSITHQRRRIHGSDDESVLQTIHRLGEAQKPSKGAPAYSRFVNRRAGRVLAACSYHLRLTPNAVTLISAAWSVIGIAVLTFATPTAAVGLLVTVCLAVGYAFDSADGQLARLRGGGSAAGEWLDHVVDSGKICALHLAVLISFYRFGSRGFELLIPLVWTWIASVAFFVFILTDQLRRSRGRAPAKHAPAPLWRSLLVAPTDYGLLLLSFVLLGAHDVFVWVYGLLLLANAAYLAIGLVKWFHDMSHLYDSSVSGEVL